MRRRILLLVLVVGCVAGGWLVSTRHDVAPKYNAAPPPLPATPLVPAAMAQLCLLPARYQARDRATELILTQCQWGVTYGQRRSGPDGRTTLNFQPAGPADGLTCEMRTYQFRRMPPDYKLAASLTWQTTSRIAVYGPLLVSADGQITTLSVNSHDLTLQVLVPLEPTMWYFKAGTPTSPAPTPAPSTKSLGPTEQMIMNLSPDSADGANRRILSETATHAYTPPIFVPGITPVDELRLNFSTDPQATESGTVTLQLVWRKQARQAVYQFQTETLQDCRILKLTATDLNPPIQLQIRANGAYATWIEDRSLLELQHSTTAAHYFFAESHGDSK